VVSSKSPVPPRSINAGKTVSSAPLLPTEQLLYQLNNNGSIFELKLCKLNSVNTVDNDICPTSSAIIEFCLLRDVAMDADWPMSDTCELLHFCVRCLVILTFMFTVLHYYFVMLAHENLYTRTLYYKIV